MKITKAYLKKVIKEEIEIVKESNKSPLERLEAIHADIQPAVSYFKDTPEAQQTDYEEGKTKEDFAEQLQQAVYALEALIFSMEQDRQLSDDYVKDPVYSDTHKAHMG